MEISFCQLKARAGKSEVDFMWSNFIESFEYQYLMFEGLQSFCFN